MKPGLKDLIGKRIAAVVVAENAHRNPRQQVFLAFADGTSFEFHGSEFTCNAGLDPAERIEPCVEGAGGRIVRVYGDVRQLAPVSPATADAAGQPVERLMAKDLAAWRVAKDAIARARYGAD